MHGQERGGKDEAMIEDTDAVALNSRCSDVAGNLFICDHLSARMSMTAVGDVEWPSM